MPTGRQDSQWPCIGTGLSIRCRPEPFDGKHEIHVLSQHGDDHGVPRRHAPARAPRLRATGRMALQKSIHAGSVGRPYAGSQMKL